MSEIKFSDGMPVRERRSSTSIYPEELLDKKCGGCMRCQPRKRKGETDAFGFAIKIVKGGGVE